MPRVVADRVGVDLRRAEPAEEATGKVVGQQRAGAGVVRVRDRPATLITDDLTEPLRDTRKRLVPSRLTKEPRPLLTRPNQRCRQPCRIVQEHTVVGDRALAAELPLRDGMINIAAHLRRVSGPPDHHDPTGVVTITLTRRFDALRPCSHLLSVLAREPYRERINRTETERPGLSSWLLSAPTSSSRLSEFLCLCVCCEVVGDVFT